MHGLNQEFLKKGIKNNISIVIEIEIYLGN